MTHYFILFIYQPFFNLLVFFYWMLDSLTRGHGDMGIAVILLTIVIRILLYPLSLAEEKSETDRHEITEQIKQIEEEHSADPIAYREAKKEVIKTNKRVLLAESFNLLVQVVVALMLWKIFSSGLKGEDFHLLYPFMPDVKTPFNLVFLGKFDLTHAPINNWKIDWHAMQLNIIQSSLIFILETILMLGAKTPVSKKQFIRLQFILPIVSFFIFLGLPAGKKVFIITTLIISIILNSIKTIRYRFKKYREKVEAQEAAAADGQEQVVVDVK